MHKCICGEMVLDRGLIVIFLINKNETFTFNSIPAYDF